MNFKEIHLGHLIKIKVTESNIKIDRICNFMKCTPEEVDKMYKKENLPSDILLKWSKLLEYDFFRIYSQHLILYAPVSADKSKRNKTKLPMFRKNIYTQEIIDFILEQIKTKQMTKIEVIDRYRIPKTTLYKWINKHG
ncbi:hypothetical protein EB1_12600 [Empedobacter brevis NBRC 14943 = ATCC 43319]|uniref:Uncharacterized protein n=1 Tax=Empedobacter brevis NBRC 14943 = ATCC 43319 TaxID=1218108 RepID=A0A511NF58_9FLAO|nr:hypothetical protein [Empedobacter brevis]GEM51470.1 hypothetical protein EB1_12600 [Empedobacter brevis NBRC 14943 = ATCC 43319]